ncbi:MAG TPA: ABC transporter ATP-binding protein, partial [Anaerolineae bacterium]|nr:ABC transporter ATP-binding protein [Anaerolineae bacterium]
MLKNVSFEVYQGETLSLIGANGAGKSTLFKLLTRIIRPTYGTIEIQGRVSALLELGTGFHPDLTGRENIYLGGTLAGLSQAEVEQNIQAIIDFADIGQFIDAPVRHYSSGMFIRLGFALATHISPDILVVDEVLAVGDVSFQKKCLEKIHQMRHQSVTVILVSHDMSVVRAISDRVLWLKNGLVQAVGSPDEIIQAYLADQRAVGQPGRKLEKRGQEAGKIVEIESVEFLNGSGKSVLTLETGHEATIRINYLAHQRVEMPIFGLAIHSSNGIHVNGPNSDIDDFPIDFIEGRGSVEYEISFLPLLGGTYSITVGVFDRTTTITYDACDRTFSFVVKQSS